MKRDDIEIMAPVGSWESLAAAINAGADSVYFGAGGLNMRAKSSTNFTLDDLGEIVRRARAGSSAGAGKKVKTYLTVNTVIYDDEAEQMRAVIDRAAREGVDAVIAADQAAILYARSVGMNVHISTQLNVSNVETLRFYAQWADVVVLARELNLERIAHIHSEIERLNIRGPGGELVKIEMFAHGALCMAVSGKCYLSLHESGNSANRGACRQICRRGFVLSETGDAAAGEHGENYEIAVEQNWLLSPKDLCTVPFLDRFIAAGVRVLKIEGRARSAEYVGRTVEVYGEAVAAIAEGKFTPGCVSEWVSRLAEVYNRGFWGGWYQGATVPELSENYGSSATRRKVYVGKVTNFFKRVSVAEIQVEAAPLESGADVIVMGETTGAAEIPAVEVFVADKPVSVAPQGVCCSIKSGTVLRRGDKLYKLVAGLLSVFIVAAAGVNAQDKRMWVWDDYNFDGKKDYAIPAGNNGPYGAPTYRVYLRDAGRGKSFTHSEEFTSLMSEYISFTIDDGRKLIYTTSKNGCCDHTYMTFAVENGLPVMIEERWEAESADHLVNYQSKWSRDNGKTNYETFNVDDEIVQDYMFYFRTTEDDTYVILLKSDDSLYLFVVDPADYNRVLMSSRQSWYYYGEMSVDFRYYKKEGMLEVEIDGAVLTITDDGFTGPKGQSELFLPYYEYQGSLAQIPGLDFDNVTIID